VRRFEDLFAWRKARELSADIYRITKGADFSRDFGLRDQIRRAAVSVMSNIAEGFERGSSSEFHQFLTIAKASCGEVRSQLYVASDAGYMDEPAFRALIAQSEEVSRIISGLRSSIAEHRPATKPRSALSSTLLLFLSAFAAFNFSLSTFHFSLSVAQAAPATVHAGGELVYPGSGDTIYVFGGSVDVFKNAEAFMTVNGRGLVSARKSRFSEMRKSAPTHSAYAPIRASAGLRPQLRYAAMRAEGTASSSSITHPILFQKRWHSFNNTAGMLRPTSATTNRGRNTLARPAAAAAAAFLSSSSQSALRSAPKAYTYSLLSRTRRKPFLKNFVSGFLDSGQDLAPGHAFEWRTVFFNVRPCPVQGGESSRQINPAILFFRHFQSCCLTHTDTVLNPPGQVKAAAA